MPKRSIQAFQPKGLRPDHRFYSDDDIEAIIVAAGEMPSGNVEHLVRIDGPDGRFSHHTASQVPRSQALSERLEQAANLYTSFSSFQTEPTAKQICDAMADIEEAAAKLIAALHLPEALDQDPLASLPAALRFRALQEEAAIEAGQLGGGPFNPSAEGLLRDSVRGVYRLHKWALNVQARRRTDRQTPRAKRHAGDEYLDWLFKGLACIWEDVFKRPIATSVASSESANAGQAGGPMLRFFSACLKPILKDKTPAFNAIRGRIRRLFPGRTARRRGAS